MKLKTLPVIIASVTCVPVCNSFSLTAPVPSEGSSADDPHQLDEVGVLHRLPGHAVILKIHSEYFKAALSPRWQSDEQRKVRNTCSLVHYM